MLITLITTKSSRGCCGKSNERLYYNLLIITKLDRYDGGYSVEWASPQNTDLLKLIQKYGRPKNTVTSMGLDKDPDFMKQLQDRKLVTRRRRLANHD